MGFASHNSHNMSLWYYRVMYIVLFASLASMIVCQDAQIIETNSGPIRGDDYLFESEFLNQERNVSVYLGIPYAQPPIGKLRFKPPVMVLPWNDVLEATEVPNACVQQLEPYYKHRHNAKNISEDCLYINIFVPRPTPDNAAVMVWIHGGFLQSGSGLDHPVNPIPLSAVGDVIIVTLNYRLGILGFLSTGDDVIPPNIGLLDQRLAMKWVYDNIAAFGGDPNKVTLFGQGSGAACISWHAVSDESKQYFRRGIMQSGDPFETWTAIISLEEASRRARGAALLAGCDLSTTDSSDVVLDCLSKVSADVLAAVTLEKTALIGVAGAWHPIEDGVFFTKPVAELISDGALQDVDIIIGSNKDDGTFLSWIVHQYSVEKPSVDLDAFTALSSLNGVTDSFFADLVRLFYVSDEDFPEDLVDALSATFGENYFHCGVVGFSKQVQRAGGKVYMYHMTYEPTKSVWNSNWNGAGLGEELQFVFGRSFQSKVNIDVPDVEKNFSLNVMYLWTNFAKSGNPLESGNSNDDALDAISDWPEFTFENRDYKELDLEFETKHHLRGRYCRFWKIILPTLVAQDKELQRLKRNLLLRTGLRLG